MTVVVKDLKTSLNIHTPLEVIAARINLPRLSFTMCSVHLPPIIPLSAAYRRNIISEISLSFILRDNKNIF
jgi:hypothetical protein